MTICVVPFAFVLCRSPNRRTTLFWSLVGGFAIWRPLEDSLSVYGQAGVGILCLWQAATLLPVGLGFRAGYQRGWSMTWLLPTLWVGGESLRMCGPVGFPFGALAIPSYEQEWLIQIADLGGLPLVSYLFGLSNGLVLDLCLMRCRVPGDVRSGWRKLRLHAVSVLSVWVLAIGYGQFRIHQVDAELVPGPRVTVVQPDVPFVEETVHGYDPSKLLKELQEWSEKGVNEEAAELVLWPESMNSIPLFNPEYFNHRFDDRWGRSESQGLPLVPLGSDEWEQRWDEYRSELARFFEGFVAWVRSLGVPVLVGQLVSIPSMDSASIPFDEFNAAQLFVPGIVDCLSEYRQFKMRLFPVGEYLPFRESAFARWLTQSSWWRERVKTLPDLEQGTERRQFYLNDETTFAVAICSEILYPESSSVFLAERFGDKEIQFVANIANEGRFRRNRAQLIPYALLPFRAIEGRIAVARCANTGISGFVDPVGRLYGAVRNGKGSVWTGLGMPEREGIRELVAFRQEVSDEGLMDPMLHSELEAKIHAVESLREEAGVSGRSTQTLYLTHRVTPYQRLGDWFGKLLLILLLTSLVLFPENRRLSSATIQSARGEPNSGDKEGSRADFH